MMKIEGLIVLSLMDDDFVWTTIKHKHEIVTSMITKAEGIFE